METATTPHLPPVDNVHMVDASQYAAHPNYQTAYYFATPSGRWQCAIIPRVWAGCQAAGAALAIAGAPARHRLHERAEWQGLHVQR
jgi:hypothetical protein